MGSDPGVLSDDALDVVPATIEHVETLLAGADEVERRFGWTVVDGYLEFPEALPFTRDGLVSGDREPAWWTHLFVHRVDDALVGLGGYKGAPVDGIVEIGYGIAPAYRGRGLATSAASELVDRARASGVATVIAHTLAERNASTSVLEHCGFEHTESIVDPDDGPIWRWELSLA